MLILLLESIEEEDYCIETNLHEDLYDNWGYSTTNCDKRAMTRMISLK